MSFNLEVKDEIKSLKVWNVNSQLKQEEQVDRLNAREHFLAVGFVNDPNKKSHLEISFKEEKKAEPPKKSDEVLILEEIRDLLKKEKKSTKNSK